MSITAPTMRSMATIGLRATTSILPRRTVASIAPIQRINSAVILSRTLIVATKHRAPLPKRETINISVPQKRTFLGGKANTWLLSRLEENANKNPADADAQAHFYKALLKENMGPILITRYQSGQYNTNPACDEAYRTALAAISSGGAGAYNASALRSQGLSQTQIQAVGQAVAAATRGGNIGIAQGASPAGSTGDKTSPLYVVVDESIGGLIFKWVKFLLYFALITYFLAAMAGLLMETLVSIGGRGKLKGDNEAKAEQQTVRFSDVHGCDEAKEELQEVVDFLKNPDKFSTLGGKLPKGVLLVGPPGTGKTLLARAVAGEAGVPFFFMSGSEFDEIYVGVGAKRVRELFSVAKGKQPAIVFIDELDAIGGKRSPKDPGYAKQTLNQLLTELDGFDQNSGVIILAATNFPEMLDKALTRPGRFDRNVVVGLPDVRGRMAILQHHMKNIISGATVDIETLAAGTPGFSGAELENVVNQAAVHASKAKSKAVEMFDFEWAKDKVMMGAEKRSMIITDKEKEMTAYHEAGHALAVMFTNGADKLHKITIMPRGQALGMTMHLPETDKYSKTMNEYYAHIDVCLGGKIAEEMVYGSDQVTSGCSSDLTQATRIAYAMVTQFGMSEVLGNVDLESNYSRLSSETKRLIESEVKRTIEESRVRTTALLESKRHELDLLAKALVVYEWLDRDEAFKIVRGEPIARKAITSMHSAPIKVPEMKKPGNGNGGQSGLPELPPIPGSQLGGGPTPPGPVGGVAA